MKPKDSANSLLAILQLSEPDEAVLHSKQCVKMILCVPSSFNAWPHRMDNGWKIFLASSVTHLLLSGCCVQKQQWCVLGTKVSWRCPQWQVWVNYRKDCGRVRVWIQQRPICVYAYRMIWLNYLTKPNKTHYTLTPIIPWKDGSRSNQVRWSWAIIHKMRERPFFNTLLLLPPPTPKSGLKRHKGMEVWLACAHSSTSACFIPFGQMVFTPAPFLQSPWK